MSKCLWCGKETKLISAKRQFCCRSHESMAEQRRNRERAMIAKPEVIHFLSKRDKCWSCRHKFSKPVILPVVNPEQDKYQPNYNSEVKWHQYETHGIPPDIAKSWLLGTIYGLELTLFGARF